MTRSFSRRARAALLSLALAGLPASLHSAPGGDLGWYYRIGGADAVFPGTNRGTVSATLGGSASLGRGFNCGAFDLNAGISNILNSLQNAPRSIARVMQAAATNAIANLPLLIVQRANPGLYEMLQQMMAYASGQVSLAAKSCEQMQSDIARGQNPFDRWLVLSKSYTWRDRQGRAQTGSGSTDVIQALEAVETAGGDRGVPWLGGRDAGGAGQPPIRLVKDVVQAGYNIELGRTDVLSGEAGSAATRVGQAWPSPAAAQAYAVEVLGDMEFSTRKGAVPVSTPGHGLLPRIERDRGELATALAGLVNGATAPTPAQLAKVSAPGTLLTREVLEAIRKLPERERGIAVGKLAGEAAVAANIERALMLRRLLLAGWQEPNLYGAGVGDDVARLVAVLDREVDQLLYETRVRKEIFAGTAGVFLEVGQALDQAGAPGYRRGDARPLENSGVRR